MSQKISLRFFNDREIRAVWDEAGNQWWFAVVDIVAAVSESSSPQNYWYVLKNRLKKAKNETLTKCKGFKLVAADGKRRLTDCLLQKDVRNTDFQFICDHDILDCTRSFVMGRAKFRKQFDVIQIQNTRERRRIVGDIVLQPSDFYANRKYDDTVVQAMSNFDTHGFVVHPMFMLQPPTHDGHFANWIIYDLASTKWSWKNRQAFIVNGFSKSSKGSSAGVVTQD